MLRRFTILQKTASQIIQTMDRKHCCCYQIQCFPKVKVPLQPFLREFSVGSPRLNPYCRALWVQSPHKIAHKTFFSSPHKAQVLVEYSLVIYLNIRQLTLVKIGPDDHFFHEISHPWPLILPHKHNEMTSSLKNRRDC